MRGKWVWDPDSEEWIQSSPEELNVGTGSSSVETIQQDIVIILAENGRPINLYKPQPNRKIGFI